MEVSELIKLFKKPGIELIYISGKKIAYTKSVKIGINLSNIIKYTIVKIFTLEYKYLRRTISEGRGVILRLTKQPDRISFVGK